MSSDDWAWSEDHRQPCRVVETASLWGETICRVWLPGQDVVVRVNADHLKPLNEIERSSSEALTYVVAAARVADALTQDVLLAPIESSVIPLPHQIRALSRAVSGDRVRYLLADEVGLGKTIEAGLIMRELKLRGLVQRTLVVAPKGLLIQWVAEMRTHFGETFRLLNPGDFDVYRRIWGAPGAGIDSPWLAADALADTNLWRTFDQVICSVDSVKPVDSRRGWSREQLAAHNQERFLDLVSAGWDLIIVDEAHRLGGSTDLVARHRLGRALSEAAPYLLLLTATPHQGKSDAFHRLVSLLDADAFPDVESVTRERLQPYLIRAEKRRAIDADGASLFKPRTTKLEPISWTDRHRDQRLLYEAVTEYVRNGYNQALLEKKNYLGFLMILMQRLVTSSTRAIRTTLERRLEVLREPDEQLSLFPVLSDEEWADLDGQEQLNTLLSSRLRAMKSERQEVELLLEAARRTEARGADPKAEALLDLLYRLQQEERDPNLKVLLFTEFVPTQQMLTEFLENRGFTVACLNGSMDMDERGLVQRQFADKARLLVSTDAGGEGLNLQFCHVVLNYDLPWNPMRLEQRIGRVDRIGQTKAVRAINFVLEGTVEHRVREVLEEKLAVILHEFGVDKAGDVLDSAEAGRLFDELYVDALVNPDLLETRVEKAVAEVRERAETVRESSSLLGAPEDFDPTEAQRLRSHPLPYWVERMTTSYLAAHGGSATKTDRGWQLTWPDGSESGDVVFSAREAELDASVRHLTIEAPRVRGLAMRLPRFASGQPVPVIRATATSAGIRGLWSLWRIELHAADWHRRRVMPVFLHDDGRTLAPTARFLWDQLLAPEVERDRHVEGEAAAAAFAQVWEVAERQGKPVYDDLVTEHGRRLSAERAKLEEAFSARRRAIERIGLPEVRKHRLPQLGAEERQRRHELDQRSEATPEMTCVVLVRVEGAAGG